MKSLKSRILEKQAEPTAYHKSYTSAINAVEDYAKYKGFELDQDEYSKAYIDAFFKPTEGQTKRDTLTLFKGGKAQRKMLHVQIYRMNPTTYEFNAYIN